MAHESLTLEERLLKINEKMLARANFSIKNKQDAEDVVQNVMFSVLKKINEDKELVKKFQNTEGYFENYLFRSLYNKINTYHGKKPKEDDKNKKELESIKDDDMIIFDESKESNNLILNELKKELNEEEKKFIEIYLQVAEEESKKIFSEMAKRMKITNLKIYDIKRRVQRKYKKMIKKKPYLKDVSATVPMFGFGLFSLFTDMFKAEIQSSDASKRITQNVMNQLSPEMIATLSKIIK